MLWNREAIRKQLELTLAQPTALIAFCTFIPAYVQRDSEHDLAYWLLFMLIFIIDTVLCVMNAYNNITWVSASLRALLEYKMLTLTRRKPIAYGSKIASLVYQTPISPSLASRYPFCLSLLGNPVQRRVCVGRSCIQ